MTTRRRHTAESLAAVNALQATLLSEASTEISHRLLVEAALGMDAYLVARVLFHLLRRFPREAVIDRTVALLSSLADHDETWKQIVRGSIARRGRCPKLLRRQLRLATFPSRLGAVAPGAVNLVSIRHPTRITTTHGKPDTYDVFATDASITVTTAMTSIHEFPAELLRTLLRIPPGRKRVGIDLTDVEHLYIFGLAAIANWLRSTERQGHVANATSGTRQYLDRIGFLDVIEGRAADLWHDDEGYAIALQRVDPKEFVEHLAGRLIKIVDRHGLLGADDRSGLLTTFSEMMENVQRHAGDYTHAYIGAQYYPKKRKLSVIIIDNGIGVRQSFLVGTNQAAAKTATTDAVALEQAIQPLVTSKKVRSGEDIGHSGYGLYVVSELVLRNHGTFSLTSGDSTLVRFQQHGRPRSRVFHHPPWKGTIVSIVLDLNQLLSISEVYASLPMVEGYSNEDFFDG